MQSFIGEAMQFLISTFAVNGVLSAFGGYRLNGSARTGSCHCRIIIRDTSPSRTVNMKWLGPL